MRGVSENVRDGLLRLTPFLRRFARALVAGRGGGNAADDLVQTALTRALAMTDADEAVLRTSAYASILQLNRGRIQLGQEDAARKTRRRGLAHAMDRLPLEEREVLLLIVLERLSYDDAAVILGLPRTSVIARLIRARASLAGAAGDEGLDPPRIPHLRVVK